MKRNIIQLAILFCPLIFASCDRMDMIEPGLLVPETVDEDPFLPSLKVNGYLLHVETFGNQDDPLLINIHGGPGDDYRSMLNAANLADEGFFVVFYDQVGTGLSQRVSGNIFNEKGSIDLFFDNLKAIINYYKTSDLQKVFLLGHSWGAMIAAGYVDKYPEEIDGMILSEPGGLTWDQTSVYLDATMEIKLFSEALNDALFPEQIFCGCSEDEVLDYKASYFNVIEGVTGNAGPVPFFRCGVTIKLAAMDYAGQYGFDFTKSLENYKTKVLFLYSELNEAYGEEWAYKVGAPFPNIEYHEISGTGHDMLYFSWDAVSARVLTYLNELR